jgi:hypothetical protein
MDSDAGAVGTMSNNCFQRVGQGCCFALIAISANGDVSGRTSKTSLRSFLRQFRRRGSAALPQGKLKRPIPK